MTNFTESGVTNVAESTTLGTYVAPDPTKCHTWMDDFDSFLQTQTIVITDPGNATINSNWLVTQTGGGTTATAVVADADGGILLMTTDNTAAHGLFAQWQGGAASVAETFTWEAGKAMWCKARFKVSNATNTALMIGLAVTDITPLDAADGIFFIKADASTTLQFKAIKTGVGNTTATVGTLANDTYVTVGFAYLPNGDYTGSGYPLCNIYLNDVRVGQLTSFTNFPATELALTFGVQNGAAGSPPFTSSTDYLFVAKER